MPDPKNNIIRITVQVNFNGVTYDPANGFSGDPSWNINPSPAPVNPVKTGDTNTIQWNLVAAAVPNPFTASFGQNAIVFGGPNPWTGGPPTIVNSTTVTALDNFNGLPGKVPYYYSITVQLNGAVNGQTVNGGFSLDPDVENEAGTVNPAMTK